MYVYIRHACIKSCVQWNLKVFEKYTEYVEKVFLVKQKYFLPFEVSIQLKT